MYVKGLVIKKQAVTQMSHNTMGAWFSSTDNQDDRNAIRFSGVFGKLDQPEASTVWRFNYMDKKFEAKISDIFEEAEKPQQNVPEEWLGKIKIQTYAPALRVTKASGVGASYGGAYGYTRSQLEFARQQRQSSRGVRSVDDFDGDFWGFQQDAYQSLYGSMEAQVAGLHVPGPKLYDLDDPEDVKEIRGQYVNEIEPVGENPEEYERMAKDFGPDAADAFWDIQNCITALEDSEDLLTSVVEEACGMMKDPQTKLKAMRAIYESLDSGSRDSIATSGL